jgi:ATP-dependent helicase HrpB
LFFVNQPYPVLEILPALKEALKQHPVTILQAPPGAGKSTVLPLHLLHQPWLNGKKVVMLEPRRLAARSVAMRMAEELNEAAGETIGYRVRFESVSGKNTQLEVVTEGIFTRMLQSDNALEEIGLVIFDEFHERSLASDLALAMCYQVQQVLRPDLRLLIMSATLEVEKIAALFNNAPIIKSTGRQFPVTILYTPPERDEHVVPAVCRVIKKALREQTGDLLVFLPGAGEILRTKKILEDENVAAVIVPLYGDLLFRKQQEAILPNKEGRRKIVLATSIAETSLTIEGITTVVDSGYARVPRFDPRSGLTRLETVKLTQDSASQRAGRAGRLGPGTCYRLWSQSAHHLLVPTRQPEILEADLASLVLELANWGSIDVRQLKWITPPPHGAFLQAVELLHNLQALEENKITTRGRKMLSLPTHPRLAHMLLGAADESMPALALATDLAAILEERDFLPDEAGADLSLRLEILRRWRRKESVTAEGSVLERIERLASSWRKLFKIQMDNSHVADSTVGRLIMEAYPERVAQLQEPNSRRYKLANGRVARLPETDHLQKEQWLAIAQLDAGTQEGKIFLAAPLDVNDLLPGAEEKELVKWDNERGMISAAIIRQRGNLILSSRPLSKIADELRLQVLCEAIRQEGFKMLPFTDAHRAWQARVASLRLWRPEENWPDVSEENLMATVEAWLAPFIHDASKRSDLQRIDLQTALTGCIPWPLQAKLEKLAPVRLQVPSGSFVRLNYFMDGRAPVMEVRLQEMFGLLETPAVNEGRTRIVVHLLSPGYKPVQVTQDLKSFWQTAYHEVRKELRARYPKHHWPEDPWTAQAVRGVKRKQ